MLIGRYELYKVAFAIGVGILSYASGAAVLSLLSGFRLKL
jgi:hypothetical protein